MCDCKYDDLYIIPAAADYLSDVLIRCSNGDDEMRFTAAVTNTVRLGAYVAAKCKGISPDLPLKREGKVYPYYRMESDSDCGRGGGCGKQERNTTGEAIYHWFPAPDKDSWFLRRKAGPQSGTVSVFRLSRWTDAENTWLCVFCYDDNADNAISVAPEDSARLFCAKTLEEAKRYVERNIYPRIRINGGYDAPVAPDAFDNYGDITGILWFEFDNGTHALVASRISRNFHVCDISHGDVANIYVPTWGGPFEGDASYPFYAPSLSAAKKIIEDKAREKIEANYDKWVRLKEAWLPLE